MAREPCVTHHLDRPGLDKSGGRADPRGTPQNRPVGDTSKPASWAHPGLHSFYVTGNGFGNSFSVAFFRSTVRCDLYWLYLGGG